MSNFNKVINRPGYLYPFLKHTFHWHLMDFNDPLYFYSINLNWHLVNDLLHLGGFKLNWHFEYVRHYLLHLILDSLSYPDLLCLLYLYCLLYLDEPLYLHLHCYFNYLHSHVVALPMLNYHALIHTLELDWLLLLWLCFIILKAGWLPLAVENLNSDFKCRSIFFLDLHALNDRNLTNLHHLFHNDDLDGHFPDDFLDNFDFYWNLFDHWNFNVCLFGWWRRWV